MRYVPLWKYCSLSQCHDFLLSLRLLGDVDWPAEKQLACLYAVSNHPQQHYTSRRIAKRDGTFRRLHVPDPLLKTIQRNILHTVLDGWSLPACATAYHPGADILANASVHVGQPCVLKLDIEDFFGSITYPMVYRHAFPTEYFPPAVGTMLASLCCYHDTLPQGAPTSAAVSNLVMGPFDRHMAAWCNARGIRYTRYSDDMTFSGALLPGPIVHKVRGFLGAMGFALNETKTRWIPQQGRQLVTGVVVNEKPQAPRGYRRALRQEIHYCCLHGVASHLEHIGDTDYLPFGAVGRKRYLRSLLGRVQYVLQINPQDAAFQDAEQTVRRLLSAELSAAE